MSFDIDSRVAALGRTFHGLEPAAVWHHFATLCAIPRASKQEQRLRERLIAWASAKGLAHEVDAIGNLYLRKPASKGKEGAPTVVLQAHLDMVCQKNSDSAHDFTVDPIAPTVKDGWVVAEKTTLGADNGMGVAMILSVFEDPTLAHGPLEAILTIDEETGMTGAHGMEPGKLKGTLMLNLDTEDWGEFFLGCAGGLDVDVKQAVATEPKPAGWQTVAIAVRGLRGGHSGVDIHENRGNAIRLLVSALHELKGPTELRLCSLEGGTARNAIAREALAVVALPEHALAKLPALLAAQQTRLRAQLGAIDPNLTLVTEPASASQVLTAADEQRWLGGLAEAPYGVRRMSDQVPGVVETSNNLGVVKVTAEGGHANFMVRSLVDGKAVELAEEIVARFKHLGLGVEKSGAYPGWAPNASSPLLARCQQLFTQAFGHESKVKVIHAGLECGLIGAKYPGMDTVSFGPSIRGAHAPGERVEVATVAQCFSLVKLILANV